METMPEPDLRAADASASAAFAQGRAERASFFRLQCRKVPCTQA